MRSSGDFPRPAPIDAAALKVSGAKVNTAEIAELVGLANFLSVKPT